MEAKDHREGHRQRLREKFLKSGLSGFHDYEIVELLLTLGTPRKDCKETAKAALKKFGSLRGVLEASNEDLQEISGIGPSNIFGLKLTQEVARKFLEEKLPGKPFCRTSQEVCDYLYHSMRDLKTEVFKVIYLDSASRIIDTEDLFSGSLTSSAVYPRKIIERGIKKNAAALVFVHNHPSGSCRPSGPDLAITRELVFAARLVELKVLDHVIIGDNDFFSFADQGLMEKMELELKQIRQVPGFYGPKR